MKKMCSAKHGVLFSLLLAVVSLVLQGCGGDITVKPGSTIAEVYDVDGQLFYGLDQGIDFAKTTIVRDGDTSIVSTMNAGDDSTALVAWNHRIETRWKTVFERMEREGAFYPWHTGSTINLLSGYYNHTNEDFFHYDSLSLTVRRFDASSGRLLEQKNLGELPVNGGNRHKMLFRVSANRSYLLMVAYHDYEDDESNDEQKILNVEVFLLQPDMATVQRKAVTIRVHEDYDDFFSSFAVGNRGDIYYDWYIKASDSTLQQSVVQLNIAENRADTISTLFPRFVVQGEWSTPEVLPRKSFIKMLPNDTLLFACQYGYEDITAFISTGKIDFASKRYVFSDTLLFDNDEVNDYLIDSPALEEFTFRDCILLSSGETILILEREHTRSNSKVGDIMLTGPIVLVKIGANGGVQWQSSIIKDNAHCVPYLEEYLRCHVTDTSIYLLYRNRDVDDGMVLSEFMLDDGRSRWREFPVIFSSSSAWYPDETFWYNDTVILYAQIFYMSYKRIQMKISDKYHWFDKDVARRIVNGKRMTE